MYLGARDLSYQWNRTRIDQQMVFASEFAAIDWVSACVLAPRQVQVRLQRQRKLDPT